MALYIIYLNKIKFQWKESSEKSSSDLDFLIDFNKHLIDLHGSNKQPPNLFFTYENNIKIKTELFVLLLNGLVLCFYGKYTYIWLKIKLRKTNVIT